MRTTCLLSLLVVFCATFVTAQALPDAPSAAVVKAVAEDAAAPALTATKLAVSPISPKPPAENAPEQRKVIDKKFMLLGGLVLATTAADMEFTQACQDAGTCKEMNPTIPRERWAKHMVNVPTNAAVMYWAYRWKKQGKKLWWVPPLVDIGVHAVGLGSNVRFAW